MTRVTLDDKLVERLEAIKQASSNWRLRGARGLDEVVAFLVEDYEQRRTVERMLEDHQKEMTNLVYTKVEDGVVRALKKWIQNVLSFGGTTP